MFLLELSKSKSTCRVHFCTLPKIVPLKKGVKLTNRQEGNKCQPLIEPHAQQKKGRKLEEIYDSILS